MTEKNEYNNHVGASCSHYGCWGETFVTYQPYFSLLVFPVNPNF